MTPMLERLINTTPNFKENLTNGVPLNRIGIPDEVANPVLFLCSKEASYITGQYIAVDGGWVAR